MTEREMFEEWLKKAHPQMAANLLKYITDGNYLSINIQNMWEGWQARAKIDRRKEQG